MTLPSKTDLITTLARHQGRERGVSAAALAQSLGCTTRHLRKLISQAREDGIAICGKPATGYFVAVTPDELDETCQFLRGRALHSLRRLSRMTNVALPTLVGQLLINQA